MGISAVQFRLMPSSPSSDLSKILKEAQKKIKAKGGVFSSSEEQPIAFGLKALVISFAYPEEKEIDEVGNDLQKIKDVSSAEMIDYRRAIG